MFSKLPDLFERNFAIGFFLPVVIFLVINFTLLDKYNLLPTFLNINTGNQTDFLFKIVIIVIISWFLSILLSATNRDIIRLMEGYGRYNPIKIYKFIEVKRLKFLQDEISKITQLNKDIKQIQEEEILLDSSQRLFSVAVRKINQLKIKSITKKRIKKEGIRCINNIRRELLIKKIQTFPEENFLLPTPFGNIIRAFESYTSYMYGIDAIPGWNRLLAVVPKEYQDLINNAKSQVDFWINTSLLSIITLLEYIIFSIIKWKFYYPWIIIFLIPFIFFTYQRAKASAILWGDFVKSAFDVFLPDLLEKLKFSSPCNNEESKELWLKFSQAILYNRPDYLPERIFHEDNHNPNCL